MSVLTTIDAEHVDAPGDESIADSLESNHIVYFPRCPIRLPDEATLEFLRTELPARLKLKNVSYHPEVDRVTGTEADKSAPDRAFSRMVGGLAHINPLARVLDSSPYDRAMRKLHNFMKDTSTFRDDQRSYEEIRFPPYSAWMVFADSVSHGCVSGQYAFITTFILRRKNMRRPEYSPFNVLAALGEQASGRAG